MLMETTSFRSKRPRSELEDCDECLPISKRINKLHIEAQRKNLGDERLVCSHEGHTLNNNPHSSHNWHDGLEQHASGYQPPSYPGVSQSESELNGTAGLQSLSHSSVYQAMSTVTENGSGMSYAYSSVLQTGVPNEGLAVQQHSDHSPAVLNLNSQFQPDTPQGLSQVDTSMDYDPELDETENPHYYHINCILFNAHCSRLQREGYTPHSEASLFS